jgi:hypothetical protein
MLLEANVCVFMIRRDGLYGKIGSFTSLALRIEIRTGNSSRMTGRSWSSVRSVLTNSVKTCMAP